MVCRQRAAERTNPYEFKRNLLHSTGVLRCITAAGAVVSNTAHRAQQQYASVGCSRRYMRTGAFKRAVHLARTHTHGRRLAAVRGVHIDCSIAFVGYCCTLQQASQPASQPCGAPGQLSLCHQNHLCVLSLPPSCAPPRLCTVRTHTRIRAQTSFNTRKRVPPPILPAMAPTATATATATRT